MTVCSILPSGKSPECGADRGAREGLTCEDFRGGEIDEKGFCACFTFAEDNDSTAREADDGDRIDGQGEGESPDGFL